MIPKISQFLFSLSAFLLLSCNTERTPLERIIRSDIPHKLKGYEVGIFRGVRMITTPMNKSISFRLDALDNIELLNAHSDSTVESVVNLRRVLNENRIIALEPGGDMLLIYTTYFDSTYSELKGNKRFFDKSVYRIPDENKYAYRYVYVYLYPSADRSATLDTLAKMTSLMRVDDDWYYFRSFRYKEYSQF